MQPEVRAPKGFAGLAIGLTLTLIHLDLHHVGQPGALDGGHVLQR